MTGSRVVAYAYPEVYRRTLKTIFRLQSISNPAKTLST